MHNLMDVGGFLIVVYHVVFGYLSLGSVFLQYFGGRFGVPALWVPVGLSRVVS